MDEVVALVREWEPGKFPEDSPDPGRQACGVHRIWESVAVAAAAGGAAVVVTIPDRSFEDLPQVLLALTVALAAGEIARIRRAYLKQSRQRAVDAEWLRIARELHDVLVLAGRG
jgi:signal transduction histidine kinase